ncbi:hypothetical protein Tco_1475126 [Tanacetum coccineum]
MSVEFWKRTWSQCSLSYSVEVSKLEKPHLKSRASFVIVTGCNRSEYLHAYVSCNFERNNIRRAGSEFRLWETHAYPNLDSGVFQVQVGVRNVMPRILANFANSGDGIGGTANEVVSITGSNSGSFAKRYRNQYGSKEETIVI